MAHIGISILVIETYPFWPFLWKESKAWIRKTKAWKELCKHQNKPKPNPFHPHDYLWCTLIITGRWGALCDTIGNPRRLSSTLTPTGVFYMIGKPMRPSLTLTHIFYMIGEEPMWPSSISLTHIFYIQSRGSEWPLGAREQPFISGNRLELSGYQNKPKPNPFFPPPTHKYFFSS